MKLTVFFDYTCPWVRNAGLWLEDVQTKMQGELELVWKCFLLEQVHVSEGDEKVWERHIRSDKYVSRGIWAHRGGIAARQQGNKAHWRYANTLFNAKHIDRQDIRSRESVLDIAKATNLDMAQFTATVDSADTIQQIAREHTTAESMGIFGTPTIVLDGYHPMFLKLFTPPKDKSISVFKEIISICSKQYIGELKRPQPPWPKGVEVPSL